MGADFRRAAIAVVVVAALLFGCGESPEEAYTRGYDAGYDDGWGDGELAVCARVERVSMRLARTVDC